VTDYKLILNNYTKHLLQKKTKIRKPRATKKLW